MTHVEVGHDRLFELVPQSAGDDVHWDVMGDHSTAAGHGGLVRTQEDVEGSLT